MVNWFAEIEVIRREIGVMLPDIGVLNFGKFDFKDCSLLGYFIASTYWSVHCPLVWSCSELPIPSSN